MTLIDFAKGHGTANDFVVLPDPDGALDLTPALAAALCDRRRGIGGDGVLRVVRAAKHPDAAALAGDAEWFMDYLNADGSTAEMCGNGSRVFVRYLLDHGLAAGPEVPIATRAGLRVARVDEAGIRVDMGAPTLGGESTATLVGRAYRGRVVHVGNPHLVCAAPDGLAGLDLTRAPGIDAGTFPAGANVEFVAGAGEHVAMRVYERGSGETQSCGTGACAVAAVALADAGREAGMVAVDVPGGRLTVTLDGRNCWLAGPAVIVATGTVDLAALS